MTAPSCDQCGTVTPHLSAHPPHGLLCPQCAYRQNEHDEGTD